MRLKCKCMEFFMPDEKGGKKEESGEKGKDKLAFSGSPLLEWPSLIFIGTISICPPKFEEILKLTLPSEVCFDRPTVPRHSFWIRIHSGFFPFLEELGCSYLSRWACLFTAARARGQSVRTQNSRAPDRNWTIL